MKLLLFIVFISILTSTIICEYDEESLSKYELVSKFKYLPQDSVTKIMSDNMVMPLSKTYFNKHAQNIRLVIPYNGTIEAIKEIFNFLPSNVEIKALGLTETLNQMLIDIYKNFDYYSVSQFDSIIFFNYYPMLVIAKMNNETSPSLIINDGSFVWPSYNGRSIFIHYNKVFNAFIDEVNNTWSRQLINLLYFILSYIPIIAIQCLVLICLLNSYK